MRAWWQKRSLKLRLACWFAAVCLVILLGLLPFVYTQIKHRLYLEVDKQLKVDWDLVETHLEADSSGGIRWRASSPATPDSPGYLGTSFDVWVGERRLLDYVSIFRKPVSVPAPSVPDGMEKSYTLALADGHAARVFERHDLIDGRDVVLRVYRNLSGLNHTLRTIATAFLLGAPIAALLAALGGYFIAGRALHPISAMADQARRITSESLSQRLPNPNPHDELGQLAAVFNSTLERLETSFDSLKRFTADASHELRTPLTALRAVGEVALKESGDPESARDTIASMLEETQRLGDLIDILLMLARNDANQSPVCYARVNVADLVTRVGEQLDVLMAEKNQSLVVEIAEDCFVKAEEPLLRQTLFNLWHNAIFHNPPGTIITISTTPIGDEVLIEVADDGEGISEEHLGEVFARFYRIDKARSRDKGGFGLGLAIVKLLVERMGGRTRLESRIGEGSRFQIILRSC